MAHIFHEEFENLNWLPVTERCNQCINSIVFEYINNPCPNYLNDVFRKQLRKLIFKLEEVSKM